MMADIDYNALGQALNTSWGRSSTPKVASFSVKLTMLGPDRILASYVAIVSFASHKQMIDVKRAYEDEARSLVDQTLKAVKGAYKELSGGTLKTKELSHVDSLEIIGMNVHTPNRRAYFRRKTVFEIG